MPICDGFFLDGKPCTHPAKNGTSRCKRHKDLNFCRRITNDRICGQRILQTQEACVDCLKKPDMSQQLLQDAQKEISRLKQENHQIRGDLLNTLTQISNLRLEFYQGLEIIEEIAQALESSRRTPDQAPVRLRFQGKIIIINLSETPDLYQNQTGVYFHREISEPDQARLIQCVICGDNSNSTNLLECSQTHFKASQGLCQACMKEILSTQESPSCPICRKPIPLVK